MKVLSSFTQPQVSKTCMSYVEHKRRSFKECWKSMTLLAKERHTGLEQLDGE